MRRIVTGIDSDGRSCVLEDDDVSPTSGGIVGIRSGVLWTTPWSPPPAAPHQKGASQ